MATQSNNKYLEFLKASKEKGTNVVHDSDEDFSRMEKVNGVMQRVRKEYDEKSQASLEKARKIVVK